MLWYQETRTTFNALSMEWNAGYPVSGQISRMTGAIWMYLNMMSRKELYKYHPLFDWSFDDVMKFVKDNHIPYNRLHDKGYVSIGCEPCTRAILPGEDFRAGRWWWESGKKECGLHERQVCGNQ